MQANNVDPDQTPRSAVSDLGLHCLPRSHLRDNKPFKKTIKNFYLYTHISKPSFILFGNIRISKTFNSQKLNNLKWTFLCGNRTIYDSNFIHQSC